MGAIPDRPARIDCQVSSVPRPEGETRPMPVTTTRRESRRDSKLTRLPAQGPRARLTARNLLTSSRETAINATSDGSRALSHSLRGTSVRARPADLLEAELPSFVQRRQVEQ